MDEFFEVFTERVKYNKADVKKQNVENTLPVDTQGAYIEQKNIAKKKPWSAPHRQSHSGSLLCTRVPTRTCHSQPQPPTR